MVLQFNGPISNSRICIAVDFGEKWQDWKIMIDIYIITILYLYRGHCVDNSWFLDKLLRYCHCVGGFCRNFTNHCIGAGRIKYHFFIDYLIVKTMDEDWQKM